LSPTRFKHTTSIQTSSFLKPHVFSNYHT